MTATATARTAASHTIPPPPALPPARLAGGRARQPPPLPPAPPHPLRLRRRRRSPPRTARLRNRRPRLRRLPHPSTTSLCAGRGRRRRSAAAAPPPQKPHQSVRRGRDRRWGRVWRCLTPSCPRSWCARGPRGGRPSRRRCCHRCQRRGVKTARGGHPCLLRGRCAARGVLASSSRIAAGLSPPPRPAASLLQGGGRLTASHVLRQRSRLRRRRRRPPTGVNPPFTCDGCTLPRRLFTAAQPTKKVPRSVIVTLPPRVPSFRGRGGGKKQRRRRRRILAAGRQEGDHPGRDILKKGVWARDCCIADARKAEQTLRRRHFSMPSFRTPHAPPPVLPLDSRSDAKQGRNLPTNADLIRTPELLPPHLLDLLHHRVTLGE